MSEIDDKWKEAEANPGKQVDIGRLVVCDICDEDFTDSPLCGGFIFTSKGYCPNCAPAGLANIKGFGEERFIRATCPPSQSFADFVREYRGTNNSIKITKI